MKSRKNTKLRQDSGNKKRVLILFTLLSFLVIFSSLILTPGCSSTLNNTASSEYVFLKTDQYSNSDLEKIYSSVFKSMAGFETPDWIADGAQDSYNDTSMLRYLGLDYIKKQVNGVSPPTVIIFDQLVDFTHPELEDVVDKVVTIDNYGIIIEYPKTQLEGISPFNDTRFTDYIIQDGSFGHGTHVAGIIHQIAPHARIISVAHKVPQTGFSNIVNAFLDWLDNQKGSGGLRIVNISEGWNKATTSSERTTFTQKFRDIVTFSGKRILFTIAAGNLEEDEQNNWNIVYPAELGNNWHRDERIFTDDYEVYDRVDIDGGPIYANGILSVSSIYDEGSNIGLRNDAFVFDADGNGDLQLMAPGFNINSTFPILNYLNSSQTHAAVYSGTSMAAPIVAGVAALYAEHYGIPNALYIEEELLETAIYDANVPFNSTIESERIELQKRYGLGMVNPLKLFGYETLDRDSDSILDIDELYVHHTSPIDSDTDDDNLSDWEEVNTYGTNPTNSDSDNDNISDYEEVNIGADGYITDPNNADTDSDSLTDYEEINGVYAPLNPYAVNDYIIGLNPILADTDDDDLKDGWEVNSQYNPLNDNTDGEGPIDGWEDPDNDGLINLEEVAYGTDYLDDDTDNDNLLDGYEIQFCATDPLLIDTDGDGLVDDWEWVYGLDPRTPNANSDPDGDGLTNYQEYLAGTSPVLTDTDSDGMPDGWELTNNFNPLINDANLDPDTDGATNLEEYYHNTDPYDDDTDEDGMEDGWEIDYSLNPLIDDGMLDADGDGLYNIDEFVNNCDPTDTDTDNDGLNDKQEILNQCDPNDTDTDNDGWTDGFEVYTSGTEPDDADTDNDGLTDKNEFNYWKYTRGRTTAQAYAYIKDADVDNDNLNDGAELTVGTDPLNNDTDGDSLYDGSEGLYYGTDPTDYDSDNDGYNDDEEVAAGTDPNDPNDHPGSGGGGGFGW